MNQYIISKKENFGEKCWFLNFKNEKIKVNFKEKEQLFLKGDLLGLVKDIKHTAKNLKLIRDDKCFHFKCNHNELIIEILTNEFTNQKEEDIISNIQKILFEAKICFEKPEYDPGHQNTTETKGEPGS